MAHLTVTHQLRIGHGVHPLVLWHPRHNPGAIGQGTVGERGGLGDEVPKRALDKLALHQGIFFKGRGDVDNAEGLGAILHISKDFEEMRFRLALYLRSAQSYAMQGYVNSSISMLFMAVAIIKYAFHSTVWVVRL